MKYKSYTLKNFKEIPQIKKLPEDEIFSIEVVGHVFPFKTNNYVVQELIDWNNIPNDPLFILHFPQKKMLKKHHFDEVAKLIRSGASKEALKEATLNIRSQLNPHPAGQIEKNAPIQDGKRLSGIQHKYRETILFFPSQGQTCHAYCTFCFRWPQFVGIEELRFASRDINKFISYVQEHDSISDILFTGGDPLVMKSKSLSIYIDKILEADLPHIDSIRIGTKALSHWPQRFVTDSDSKELLDIFKRVKKSGRHLSIMAHVNHPRELNTDIAREAIKKIKMCGVEIRTQSPLLRHINDDPKVWAEMWKEQVRLNCIPYYMFVARDTGAHHFFEVPLVRSWEIFRDAYSSVSGLARTARGPSMSATPGKIQVLGVQEIGREKVMMLRMLQGRNPDWVQCPFFAKLNEKATWFSDLKPAFGEKKFFFEK